VRLPIERSACAKVILFGEHAVVYERPAIALPVRGLRTIASIKQRGGPFEIHALDINHVVRLPNIPPTEMRKPHPLALIAWLTLRHIGAKPPRALIETRSRIPVGSNLGSGAAISVALARALAAYCGRELTADEASALAFEVERQHHGSPSGIDNTVIAFEQPVYFVKGREITPLGDLPALPLVIADTGKSTPTRIPVSDVRAAYTADPDGMSARFDGIAAIVARGRDALRTGDFEALGRLMDENHRALQALTVSSPELDKLCDVARAAGALGAKMSGGGRGGNMIALARDSAHALALRDALLTAGARRVFSG
jgi:mevalonate kinase